MSKELLDIQPRDLCFPVEPKKQSLCSIQLTNKSDKHVAFKVKTTSPKKYCVRPNVAIINPHGKSGFTVMMQVQRAAPLDLQCKDKFLIVSTIVPSGTAEEDITSDMFTKNFCKHIEERKLRVILVCLPQSPVLSPVTRVTNHDFSCDIAPDDNLPNGVEDLPPLLKEIEELKMEESVDDSRLISDAENLVTDRGKELPNPQQESEEFKMEKSVDDSRLISDAENLMTDCGNELQNSTSIDASEVKSVEKIEKSTRMVMEDYITKGFEKLNSKINILESKLTEAEQTVVKLTEERMNFMQTSVMVERELALMKRKVGGKTVYMGFPLLYVCMVALISLSVGYLMQ